MMCRHWLEVTCCAMLQGVGDEDALVASMASCGGGACWLGVSRVLLPWVNGIVNV